MILGKTVAAASILVGLLVACSHIPEAKPSCAYDGCGPHGTCTFVGDSEICVCETGYTGPMCAECAPGSHDIDGNGLCAGACAGHACGAHERCSEVSGRPLCDCVVGYTRTDEGVCVFTGGPVDPSFDNPQPDGWATGGAATIEVGNLSDVAGGRGWARFGGRGEVFQSFEMPSYADAEPLALELERACTRTGTCGAVQAAFSIAFDDRFVDSSLPVGQRGLPTESIQVCLGERSFGRKLTLGLRTYSSRGREGTPVEDALIGRARFVPSAACAAPGTVKNGDFEEGDWTIATQSRDQGVAFVEENGTRRARLQGVCTPGNESASARINTSISIPELLARPALTFSLDGTLGGITRVAMGDLMSGRLYLLGSVRGSGKQEKVVVCLPPSSSGLAFDLHVSAPSDCATAIPNVVHVDDFVVTSDPSCVLDETVMNGGFERAEVTWLSEASGPEAAPEVVRDPAQAHSGAAYLQLRTTCTAESVGGTWSATVPPRPPAASGGPALKVWHRLRSEGRAVVSMAGVQAHQVAPSASWTEGVLCLPRHSWGRLTSFGINLSAPRDGSGACSPTELDLDDLSITLDPSCPLD